MRVPGVLTTAALTAAALFATAAQASADIHYAKPSGGVASGTCLTEATACTLSQALSAVVADDTLVLLAGTYDVTTPLVAPKITIRGKAADARPLLAGAVGLSGPTLDMSGGGALQRVALSSVAAQPAYRAKAVHVSDSVFTASSYDAAEIKAGSPTVVRDSLFHATGPFAALFMKDDEATGTFEIVNVTAVGTAAGSTGIASGSGAAKTMVNTIAQGVAHDVQEVVSVSDIATSYSSFRAGSATGVSSGLGNKGPATFKPGTFKPEQSSVTTDAGTSGVTLGPDLDGNARGLTPDIGAYEYVAAGGAGGSDPDPGGADPDPGDTDPGDTDTGEPETPTNPGGTPPDNPDPGSGDTAGKADPLPPATPPVLGQSVGLGPVKGTVTVTLPGSGEAVPLQEGANVPVGSVVDASRGTVALTSVRDKSGQTQTGRFWGGAFRVGQSRRGKTYTNLTLVGKVDCNRTRARGKVTAAARRWSRRLWGRDRGGRFRTRGRNGSATVRGTEWLTEDRCGATLFRVTDGKIVVRDNAKRKNVTLKRGGRYVARAKRR